MEEDMYDPITGRKVKSVLSGLNRAKLSKYELDEMFL